MFPLRVFVLQYLGFAQFSGIMEPQLVCVCVCAGSSSQLWHTCFLLPQSAHLPAINSSASTVFQSPPRLSVTSVAATCSQTKWTRFLQNELFLPFCSVNFPLQLTGFSSAFVSAGFEQNTTLVLFSNNEQANFAQFHQYPTVLSEHGKILEQLDNNRTIYYYCVAVHPHDGGRWKGELLMKI